MVGAREEEGRSLPRVGVGASEMRVLQEEHRKSLQGEAVSLQCTREKDCVLSLLQRTLCHVKACPRRVWGLPSYLGFSRD